MSSFSHHILVPPGAEGEAAASFTAEVEARARRSFTSIEGEEKIIWRRWGKGFPVVLLHGGSGAWNHWIHNIPVLAQYYEVIVPDIPGLGDSGDTPQGATPPLVAGYLAAGLDELGISKSYALAGFSFGGLLAGVLAALRPEGLHSLTLLGPTGLALPLDYMVRLKRPDFTATAQEQTEMQRHNLLALMISRPEHVDALALYLQSENTRRARLISHIFAMDDDCARAIKTLRCPIAGMWGADDIARKFFPERRTLFATLNPGGPFHLIPKAGHWAQFEAKDSFNQLFLEWLAQTIPPA